MSEVKCPKCGSNQISANKKGFSAGKAVAGAVLAGPVGIAAGAIGKDKVDITCLACGHQWNPVQLAKEKEQLHNQKVFADHKAWQSKFFEAYESGKMEQAEALMVAKFPTMKQTVQEAYKREKKNNRDMNILMTVLMSIIVLVGYLVIRWLS